MNNNSSRRSYKKAVIAGALGLALLAGGGATFANWYQNQAINGTAITAGQLKLSTPTVTGNGWTVAHVGADGTTYGSDTAVSDINAFRMVPGDRLTYTATVTATLQGNNLKANLVADTSGLAPAGTLQQYLTSGDPRVTLKYNSAAIANPLSAPADGSVLTMSGVQVSVILEFPFNGTTPNGNEGQTLTLDLTKIKLKLTQIAA